MTNEEKALLIKKLSQNRLALTRRSCGGRNPEISNRQGALPFGLHPNSSPGRPY